MNDPLTGQQREAVDRRGTSVVLSSGAGCGKTHVLTRRYLSHLERDEAEVGHVVAITFTDRAARQMRQRIRATLTERLRHDDNADRWARHVRDLETAPISTIHAFCGALLRQHPLEAGLDSQFDVLEDYLADNLRNEALTTCLQNLLTADGPGEDLRHLVLLHGWKPTLQAVGHLLAGDADEQYRWWQRDVTKIANGWREWARTVLLPRYVHYLLAGSPKVARCLWLLRNTPCVGPKMAVNVRKLLDKLPRLADATDLTATVKDLCEAAKVGPERAKAWPSEADYQAIKEAFEGFREDLPQRLAFFLAEEGELEEAVRVARQFVRVAALAGGAYRRLKQRHGVVDFHDLLTRARDLLRDHAEVRDQLRRRYRFFLIDELQDTDPVQMELIESLCGLGLTGGKLFAVGDASQSIYRFRGAEVKLFQDLRRQMPPEGRLELTRNFRSQPAVLDFVNALVGPSQSAGTAPYDGLDGYVPLAPHLSQVNPGACVEFLWSERPEKAFANEGRAEESKVLAARIRGMIADGERLVAERDPTGERLRRVRAADVVLLFRAMTHVPIYEAALRSVGLDYYLVGGRAFFAQQEIYDLLNLLRALENPQDAVSLAGTLRSPFCCLSDEALFLLSRIKSGLWAALHDDATCARLPADQKERADRARRWLGRWRSLKDRLPIARLLGEIFADSGYDAATQFEFLGDRKLANLWKLQDLARNFDRTGLFGLADFIARLGELVQAQPREEQAATQPENADVVRLMSIHQAKGLEFPVVILPDVAAVTGGSRMPVAHWDRELGCIARPNEEPALYSDYGWRLWEAAETVAEWREELRMLYVACTRAQDYLILSAALPARYSPKTSWMLLLSERFDVRSGKCLNPRVAAGRAPRVRIREAESSPETDTATPPE
jgi:ATP-dependent helicase/nuclease subunit A